MGTFKVNGDISATGTISASSFLGHASSATTARFLSSHDTRDDSIEPNQMKADEAVQFDFKASSTINLTDAPYSGVMSYRPYSNSSDWTGGPAHQLAFNNAGLYWRQSSGNAWLSWNKLIHSGNYTDYTVTKTGSGASGTWGINVTGSAGSVAWGNVTGKPSSFTPSSHTHDYQPIESTTFSITNTQYVSVRTPNRTAAMYYEFWDGVGWAGIRAGDIYDNNNRVLSTGNYTSYTVTKTGSGASGTWGINISGQAGSVYGPYSGNGGNQIPSYIGTNTTRFAMMRNFGSSDIGGYMDCILMNNYGWADVPYATGLGITKVNGYPRAIIANGPKTGWAYATELVTTYNYSWWCVPLSGGTMSGNLNINTHGNTMTIGSLNNAWCHFQSSADIPFYFNRRVFVDGCLGIYEMNSQGCGSSFPSSPIRGQIFFKI